MNPYRLPRTVVPTRYELRLTPDLPSATFAGEETVSVTVHEPVAEVVLNAAELEIDEASLALEQGEKLPAAIAPDEATERCRLSFPRPVPPGRHQLTLKFRGTLNDKLRGFYRSSYKGPDGETRLLAATQFEATDARRAFPCWDEPDFKAVFSTTLVVDPGLTALSNTATAEEEVIDGKKAVRFADTIPLSTYLVAFVVGELEATDPVTVGPTPLRVWCVPGKQRLAAFAQEAAAFSLKFFEDYYGRPYAGDKLDLIAIPDFAAGAMENFGAITYRETALLVDPATATHAEVERVADTVSHENAHLWFGDLVTMAWWNGLWLNEAFATFMAMLAVDAWRPRWQVWTTFGVARSAALLVDGLHSTRPVEFAVEAPGDAEAMFDVLTYEKGASVLRMLEQHVGPEVFRAGVRRYLDRHAHGNTETGDLWAALGEVSGQTVPEVLDGWIFRPGYPLLSASLESGGLLLRQQRFTYLPAGQGVGEPADGRPWKVPVQVRLLADGESRTERLLLDEAEARVPLPEGFRAAVVNEGGHGFYRVYYSPDLLAALLDRLPALSAVERFNLVNDCWAAVLAGLMPAGEYLDLTARFRAEKDRNVWTVLASSFQALNRVIEPEDRPGLAALVRDRAGRAAAELGWSPPAEEDELERQRRGDLLRLLGTLGDDPATEGKALEVYAASLNDPAAAEANVLAAAVSVLAFAGDAARHDEFFARFRSARSPQEEQRFLHALTAFRPPELVARTLALTLGGEVRTQDAPFLLRSLLTGVHSRERAWAFLRDNWDEMERKFPATGVRRMCEGVTALARPQWEREVRDFFAARKVDLGGKTLEQYLEQLRVAVALREREGDALRQYLSVGQP